MKIKSFEDYKENVRPMQELEKFNKLIKECKKRHKDLELYVPPCKEFIKSGNKDIPIIVVKSIYDGNFYEIPLSELIPIADLKKIDFSKFDYLRCKPFKSLPIDK